MTPQPEQFGFEPRHPEGVLETQLTELERVAQNLHKWYLEATKKLSPESYNPNAQKPYEEMTEEQKFIDRYIADKVVAYAQQEVERTLQECVELSDRIESREPDGGTTANSCAMSRNASACGSLRRNNTATGLPGFGQKKGRCTKVIGPKSREETPRKGI